MSDYYETEGTELLITNDDLHNSGKIKQNQLKITNTVKLSRKSDTKK